MSTSEDKSSPDAEKDHATPTPEPTRVPVFTLVLLAASAALALAFWMATKRVPSLKEVGRIDLGRSLALFVAVATAIERFWEVVFDFYEKLVLSGSAMIGGAGELGVWAKAQLDRARNVLRNPKGAEAGGGASSTLDERLAEVAVARATIVRLLADPEYVAFKRAVTLLGSLVLGEVISLSSGLRIFAAAEFAVPKSIDLVLTGLIIGSGPGPVHALIGILQGLRDATKDLSDLSRSATIQRAAAALREVVGGGAPPAPGATPAPDKQKAAEARAAVDAFMP